MEGIHMTAANLPEIPEPWTTRDTLLFSGIGLALFVAMFAFYFSLSSM
jgi:hypothetical protein